jgi:hypothetical protein
MTDKKDETAERIAQLERKVAELTPKPQPSREERERADAEHRDWQYQMQERRMNLATPPSVQQYFADGVTAADCADLRQQAHRPSGRPGMIPATHQSGAGAPKSAGDGTGYVEPRPLGPQPGINWVDAQCIADEVRQRAELKRKLGEG